jgi:hypothetical protein
VTSSAGPRVKGFESSDFSLVLGGPLFQLLLRAHLAGDALSLVQRRVVALSLFTWLPLCLLSLVQGTLLGGSVAVPFVKDLELHVRFLVALPLLVIAELVVHQRLRPVIQVFRERGIVPPEATSRFEAAVAAAYRLRNSTAAELGLLVIVYAFGIQVFWRNFVALSTTTTWYSNASGLSIAGIWYGYVSLPIFQFLLCRWYFRIFIWARFLFHVSRLPLSLVPTHPDRLGGLGFLAGTVHAFVPLATAHGVMLAGPLASRIFFTGAKLTDFKMEALLLVVLVICAVFGPLLAFAPQLAAARRVGVREYDTLAERYVREFDQKWLRGGAPADESLVGSGDIQSLADLGNSLEVVRGMRTVPITRDAVVRLAVATIVPVVPLALTMMPLEELLKKLFGMIF